MYQPKHSPGDIVHGRYKIIAFISRGGFGETYKVEDAQQENLICLLKYLKPQNNSPTVLTLAEEKFSQEADILRRLGSHNQIPQLYDYFDENLKFYLVEEYIDGQNLANELRVDLFSETKIIEVLHDVLKILDYLSQNYVIHRDIKPENLIRRSSDNKIVLVDFGAVKEVGTFVVNAQGQTILTMPIGTPGFMAPEQLDGRPEFSSDIYALGMTAIQALTGIYPSQLQRDSQDEVIWRNQTEISPKLTRILNRMVRFQTGKRYQSAQSVLNDLNAESWQDKLEKHWRFLAIQCLIAATSVAYIIYNNNQINQITNFYIKGIEEKQEGDKRKNDGDVAGADEAYDKAIKAFSNALDIYPTFTEAKVNLGHIYIQRDLFKESLFVCNNAKRDNDKNPKVWICLGNAKHGLKKYEESVQDFQQSIKLASNSPQSINDLVTALTYKGESLLAWHEVLKTQRNYGFASERLNDALEAYTQASQKQPKYLFAWTGKGKALLKLEKYNDALNAFKQALSIKQDYKPAIDGEKEARKRLNLP